MPIPRRKWTPSTKASVMRELFNGKTRLQIVTEHRLSQTQFSEWQSEMLKNLHKVFEAGETGKDVEKELKTEIQRLKQLVSELALLLPTGTLSGLAPSSVD